jgi:hypothetical protein
VVIVGAFINEAHMIADVGSGCGQDAVVDWIGKVVSEAGEPEPEPEPEPKPEPMPKPLM